MPTKNDIIKNVYTTYYGTKGQTLEYIKDDPDYEEYRITKKDVDQWFLTSHLTEGFKKTEKAYIIHSSQRDHYTSSRSIFFIIVSIRSSIKTTLRFGRSNHHPTDL